MLTTRRRPFTSFQSRFTQTPRARRAPPWRWRRSPGGAAAASAADADAANATTPPTPTLLSPLIAQTSSPNPLSAAIFWDADNVRPSSGSGGGSSNGKKDRRAAVRQTLARLAAELERAGCRVDACAAYGNAATLGEDDEDDDQDDTALCRIVITATSKRQSADMALLSDLAAFVRGSSSAAVGAAAPTQPQPPKTTSCLIFLIADDAGYAKPCAWASSAPNNAAVVACGASAAKRGPYAPPTSPLEPWRFHPVARAGAAAVVVPWVVVVDDDSQEDGNLNNLDVGAAWINPEGVFG
jgi:hypothetical protein